MRYQIALLAFLAFLVSGCLGRTADGRIVASTTVCGLTGPITGCPDYKSDPPMGGEVRVTNLVPNSMCHLSSEKLGSSIPLPAGGRVKLPLGPVGAHHPVQVTADCCLPDGSIMQFDNRVTPAQNRDISIKLENLYRVPGLDPQMCRRLAH